MLPGDSKAEPGDDALPFVLVVVPVFDEAALIERKLANLDALDYPPHLRRIVIADGGSTDGTAAIAREWIGERPGFALLLTQHRNKTAQLNDAVRAFPDGEWILVTDADAEMERNALRLLVAAAADPSVGVVGARVRPAAAHALELLHWTATDWLRGREAGRGSAAIVNGPCYLSRRAWLEDLPADTVADDVHVACRAMAGGERVAHCGALVVELRAPRTVAALLRHKSRKADAYLREVVRFLPGVHRMPAPMRGVFLGRAALLMLVPLLSLAASLLILLSVPVALVFAAALLLLTVRPATLLVLVTMVAAVALIRYPFSRQVASFPKIA